MDLAEKNKKKELHRVAVAHRDIGCAKSGFDAILSSGAEPGDNIYQPLIFGAVVSYCRPFMNSDGLGRSSKKWTRFDDFALKDRHRELIEYRNSAVAHSSISQNDLHIWPTGVSISSGDKTIVLDEPGFAVRMPLLNGSSLPNYIELCEFQIARMIEYLIPEMEARFMRKGLLPIPFILTHDDLES